MYVSRLNFQTQPGKTHQAELELKTPVAMVVKNGGLKARVLRAILPRQAPGPRVSGPIGRSR